MAYFFDDILRAILLVFYLARRLGKGTDGALSRTSFLEGLQKQSR